MEPKLLQLNFAQLQSAWAKSKHNVYSDIRKQEYHNKLSKIIEIIEKEDLSKITDLNIITLTFYIITFVFKSLEFLNSSTLTVIPFEIVAVLEEALNDWIAGDEYLIVTSLTNRMNDFSFDNTLMLFDFLYTILKINFGIDFNKKLIQINLPESLSRDYLANVVLYHELGHFIDKKFGITRTIYDELIVEIKNNKLQANDIIEVDKYLPYLKDKTKINEYLNYSESNILAMHIAEYFCDLFASQYIIDWSNKYLVYVTLNQSNYSPTHPATTNRIEFVNLYLNNVDSYLIKKFQDVVRNITGKDISPKYQQFTSTNFENLKPVDIAEAKELHYLFHYGWEVWTGDWKQIEAANNFQFSLTQEKVYEIISNLIEKSIGNYIIKKEWNKHKPTT